jgi:ADP-ribose pyrophosphatase YjhB (NUDIX family)
MCADTMKKQFVQQYVFSDDLERVALIIKLKGPDYLIGRINGQGGKVEDGELLVRAATRETKEESDLTVREGDWHLVDRIERADAVMTVFAAVADLSAAKTMECEPVIILRVSDLRLINERNPAAITSDVMPLIAKSIEILTADFRKEYNRITACIASSPNCRF